MSSQAMSWAWKQTIPPLPPLPPTDGGGVRSRVNPATTKNVLLALAEHANPEGMCFPSWRRIAVMSNCSRPTVARAIRDLEDSGLIRRIPKFRDNGGQTACEYYLPIGEGLPRHHRSRTPPSLIDTPHDLPPSQLDTAPSQAETPSLSQLDTAPVSPIDPSPSLVDTPITIQKEPKTKNTTSKGGGVLDLEKLRYELESRGYAEQVVEYALEELNRTGSDHVQFPLRYCITAADRRTKEIELGEARARASVGERTIAIEVSSDQSLIDEAIAGLPSEEQQMLRKEAQESLSSIARTLEPALKAAMRDAYRRRMQEVGS